MPVSFFDDEEGEPFEEEPTEVRRKAGKQRRPPSGQSRLVRVLLILVAAAVLVLVLSLGIKSCLDKRKIGEYNDYFNQVGQIVSDSDNIGAQVSAIFQNPDPTVRQSLESKLGDLQNAQKQIVDRAQQVDAPDDFKDENAWFVASMQVRYTGLNGLQPAMLNALGAQDNNAGAEQVSHEMLILLTSDVAYDEFFYQRAQQVLRDGNITDVKVPQSKFLKDPAMASQQTAVSVLERLKGGATAQVSGLHGVALSSVKAQPSGMTLSQTDQNSLKASDSLDFQVEVENQGEATETNVSVSITLTAPGHPSPQKVDGTIPSIAPGEKKTIDLNGLAADAGPQVAILTVQCGPVPGETKTDNNSGEFKIVFN